MRSLLNDSIHNSTGNTQYLVLQFFLFNFVLILCNLGAHLLRTYSVSHEENVSKLWKKKHPSLIKVFYESTFLAMYDYKKSVHTNNDHTLHFVEDSPNSASMNGIQLRYNLYRLSL